MNLTIIVVATLGFLLTEPYSKGNTLTNILLVCIYLEMRKTNTPPVEKEDSII